MAPAGYSGTPFPKKLGIKAGHRVALVNAPAGFARSAVELERRVVTLPRRLEEAGGLWIARPKRTSGVATDLSGDVVRAAGLATGLVDNKVCAVDETWSGLRFVVRVKDRERRG